MRRAARRAQSNKEMNEALKKQKEQEEKLALEKLQREKERDARDRARIKVREPYSALALVA